jgi:hypothetical protein
MNVEGFRRPIIEISVLDFGLESENTAAGILRPDHATPLYPKKLALTSPASGGLSVGIVRSQTQATEFKVLDLDCIFVRV